MRRLVGSLWVLTLRRQQAAVQLSLCGSPVDMRTVHNVHMITAEDEVCT